ncbi:TP901 family prophage LambdaSa04, tail tape measure protein [Lactococcus chungangensis CAU 28 = DSM 22330]|uniref:Phage tail tape measure protein, TP901 family, core region n=1 Tax=Pseudolactococcus chungangensis CAU 28 = DSM 22330 TaxID=1122154 RepID=A0A1K2HBC0_9LACT|nr:phage tail tape measure protein [Lactococcus chungangensis]PCS04872.1 TP901 family prophage LambdaSa04, tail tape measure protein [Lactococcus chungangensis CAU 28 = DSM 22330]SFZ74031.1 phage tail tape measure protein, TP901 family, core region [Lactococcus chungangensis CAU 28 = DSM 22330]
MAGKNIKGITIEIDGNATGLDKALKGVNSTSVKLNSELGQVNKLLKFDPSNVTGLSQKQELLTKSIENTSDKLNQLKSAQSQVEAQYKSGNIGEEQYRAFQREIATTEQSLKGYKSQLSGLQTEQEKLGQNTKRLNTFFEASGKSIDDFSDILGTRLVNSIKNGTATSDQLEMVLNKIGKEALGAGTDLKEMKQSLDKVDDGGSIKGVKNDLENLKTTSNQTDGELGKLGNGITSGNLMNATDKVAEVGEKLKEVAAAAQDAFRDIDDGMDTFTTTTGQNSDVIKASFDKIYTSMPIESTADLGQALGSLTQQFGFSGDKLTEYGTQLMQFAEINNTDVKSSIDNAKSAIETYNLSYDDLGSVLDTVTTVSQKTGVSVDDLMTKAVEGAPQIKALGLSFGEGTEMLGKFEQAGVDGAGALSSLSKANVVYAKDGKTLQEGLKGTIDSIKGAKSQTEALTIASEVFGTKGATRMVDAIQRGKFNLDELGGAAEKSSGTVKKTFESTEDPIDKQAVALQSAKLSFSELGATIAEGLQPILDSLIPVLKSLGDIFSNMPTGIKTFVVVLGALLVAFTTLAPFIAAMITIFSALSGAVVVAGGGMAFLTGTLLPIIGVVVAVIAVIAAIVLAIKNWVVIVEWLKGVWSSISPFFSSIFGFLASIFSGFQPVLDVFVSFFQNTVTNVMTIFNGIVSVLQGIFSIVIGIFTLNGEQIGQGFAQVFQGLIGIVSGVFSQIINFITSSLSAIVNFFSGILGGIVGIVSGIFNGIKDAFINPLETAKGVIKGIVDAIKGFFSFSITWPKIPMPHFSINPAGWEIGDLLKGKIPSLGVDWFADGGILTKPTIFGQNGNSLMVGGEAGKEAVAPLSDLMEYVEAAVANQIGDMSSNFAQMIQLLSIIASKELALDFPGGDLARISYKETEKLILRGNV